MNLNNKDPVFFYQEGAIPDKDAIWKGPGGGKSSFYTTWSYMALFFVCIFAIIFIPLLRKFPKLANSKFSMIGIAIIIGFSANSLAVAVVSQSMLEFSWKPLDTKAKVCIAESWVSNFNKLNITIHIVPLIFCLFLLASIITVPWSGSKTNLLIISCVIPIIYLLIWICTPVLISKNFKKKTTPLNKISIVYNSPPFVVEILLPITILLSCLLYVYAIRGNKK